MPKDFYTLLIIPKKSPAKRMTISGAMLKALSLCFVAMILFATYTYCDYINILREKVELARLRQQTKDQKAQIEVLADKVNIFAVKMDELRQIDKQVRVLANVEDKRNKGRPPGVGGSLNLEKSITSQVETNQRALIANIDRNVDQLTADVNDQKRSYGELLIFLKEQKSIRESSPAFWPVRGWVTSEFGNRTSPFGKSREFHKGIDIAGRIGFQVVAPADGIVAEAAYDREIGHMLRIKHGYSVVTLYGHLMKSVVKEGNLVRRGAVIGYIGNSGRSTGSHLHYSVFLNGVPVNPRKYLN